nr:hypothetical protein [Tanacetum cinerariifolium]
MSLESFQAQRQAHVGGVTIQEPVAEATRPLLMVEGADSDKTTSGGDTEILQIYEDQGKDVNNQVNLEQKTIELDQGQAGSDPDKTPESRPPPEQEFIEEDQVGPDPRVSRMALAGPNPKPTHEEFMANVYPDVHVSLKLPVDEHVIFKEPLRSSRTLSSMKNLDDAYTFVDYFEICLTRDQTVNTVVKEAIHIALQAPLRDCFRVLPEADMKEILQQRMFKSGFYKSLPEYVALYEALEASMKRANRDKFLAKKDKSRKRRHDDQDPPPPLSDSDLNNKRRHDSGASGQQSACHSEQPIEDVPIIDNVNVSNSEDTTHLPKLKTRLDWMKLVLKEDRPATPEPDWVILPNELSEPENDWANALASSYQDPDEYKLLRQTGDMSSFINWFCKQIGKKKLSKTC